MKKIIHIDMDYFFAQVEELYNPSLKSKPVAIGGISTTGRGVLSTANYIAREYGVKSAMPTALALKKCPQLVLVRPHFDRYKKASEKIFKIFRRYTEKIERLSLDEAYLDVTDCQRFNNDAVKIAKSIKQEIFEKTGLTASAGISYNKLLAKIGSDLFKPNGLSILRPENIERNIAHFSISKIWGVGKVTQAKMNRYGIYTFGDLQKLSMLELRGYFGDFAHTYYNYCRGIDLRDVSNGSPRKSLSVEHTFYQDIIKDDDLCLKLQGCYEEMMERLNKYSNRKIKSIVVKIKFNNFKQTTIETSYDGKLCFEKFIELMRSRLQELLNELPVRLLGTGVKFYCPKSNKGQLCLPIDY